MKNIMTRAWEIAKAAVKNFGGKVKQYIGGALKMTWEDTKKVALVGSEKQIKWAESIRENIMSKVEKAVKEYDNKKEEYCSIVGEKRYNIRGKQMTRMVDSLKNENKASFWINNFKNDHETKFFFTCENNHKFGGIANTIYELGFGN